MSTSRLSEPGRVTACAPLIGQWHGARPRELRGDAQGRARATSTHGLKLGHFDSSGESMSMPHLFEPDRATACAPLTGQRARPPVRRWCQTRATTQAVLRRESWTV